LETLPLDLLNTTSTVRPQDHSEKESIEQTPKIGKIPEKEKTQEREQKQVSSRKSLDMDMNIDPKLIKESEQFDSIINNLVKSQGFTTPVLEIILGGGVNQYYLVNYFLFHTQIIYTTSVRENCI